jgi:hypothetical protein
LSATQTVFVTVLETNSPPVIAPIAVQHINEGATLALPIVADDRDIPAQHLTFSLGADAPAGLSLDAETGVLTWMPSEAQGPATNVVIVQVRDDGTPSLSATQAVNIIVAEVNQPPSLTPIAAQRINEGTPVSFVAHATDADEPAQTLTFSLDPGAPAGASIDGSSGLFSWTPSEEQGPSTNVVAIRVTDNGSPSASAVTYVSVIVDEVNAPPILQPIGDQVIAEGILFALSIHASDSDLPAQLLTYHLAAGAPAGCSINASNGLLTWTPSEAQGPSTNTVTVFATDNGSPNLSAAETFTIIVTEVNSPPSLDPILAQAVHQGAILHFTASATDPDLPLQTLTFSVDSGAPPGASIDPATGVFRWLAGTTAGTNVVTIRVSDGGSPALADTQSVQIVVAEELRITQLAIAADGAFSVTWTSVPGSKYRLAYKDSFDAPQWLTIGPEITALGGSASATDQRDPVFARIYRVFLIQD